MALAFNKAKGSAIKNTYDRYEYKMGDNKVRLVGGILPRYVYWVEGTNGKRLPLECLAFNRETEVFDNKEHDEVAARYPDLKCGWAYAILCIDPGDGKVKVLDLKKKLLEQIMVAAEDLGDPTDVEKGYWVHFKKVKTGPSAFNVEYQLQPLKCKPEPLTDAQKKAIKESPTIDEIVKRATPADQKAFLDKIEASRDQDADEMDSETESEFDVE